VTDLRVNLDEEGLRTASDSLRVTESFEVVVLNEDAPKHVNIGVRGDAEPYVTAEVNNVYVEDDETVEVVVGPTPGVLDGELKLTVDYGSDSETVELVVGEENEEAPEQSVPVDESLSQPMKPETAESDDIPRVDVAVIIVLALAAVFSVSFSFVFQGFAIVGMVVASFAILGAGFVWFMSRSSEGLTSKD